MNWKKILTQLDKTEGRIIYVLMSLSLIILFVQVVTRYVFSFSFSWAEQLVRIFFVWISLMGISLAAKTNMHISVDILNIILPRKIIRGLDLTAAIFTIVMALFLGWLIVKIVVSQLTLWQTFPSIRWLPAWTMYMAGVLGMLGLSVRTAIYVLWPLLKEIKSHPSIS